MLVLFCPINLTVAYPLNENKPQLPATSKNIGWEVAEQLLIFWSFLSVSPEQLNC